MTNACNCTKYLNLVNSSAVSSTKKANLMPFKKYLIKHRQMEILRKTMANKICGSDEKLKAAEIPQSSTISNFILNENVNLEDVRRFFKETAWAKFENNK